MSDIKRPFKTRPDQQPTCWN